MATKSKTIRQRIQFAFNADTSSIAGCVFQYLIKNRQFNSREGKRKGVDAIVAFYKPFAYQGKPEVSDSELRSMARDAVEVLSRQIELLCTTFGVERPAAITLDLKNEMKQALIELLTTTTESIRVHQDIPELPSANKTSQEIASSGNASSSEKTARK